MPEGKELPLWPWSWKERAPPVAGDGGGGAAAAAADEDLHLDAGLLATLQVEWSRFKAFTANSIISEPCTVMVEDKKLPYWIRTRPFWPDLSELMLLWLKTPISTACVERLLVHDDHGQQHAAPAHEVSGFPHRLHGVPAPGVAAERAARRGQVGCTCLSAR